MTPADWIRVRVAERTMETSEIMRLTLGPANGQALPAFTAGSHVDVRVPGGPVRQYSLCNAPGKSDTYEIAILREPSSRGGSQGLHDTVQSGAEFEISAPRNHFPLDEGHSHALLLAGGIGVTPILSMAENLNARGANFALHYCVRSQAHAAFLDRLTAGPWSDRVTLHCDDRPGTLDLVALMTELPPDAGIYVCGPSGFIEWVVKTADSVGIAPARIKREYFQAVTDDIIEEDSAFDVEIASTGQLLHVPAGKPIVEVLMENDVDIVTSCEQGICGSCVTKCLEGEVDHRDQLLSDEEKAENLFTPCCSRARSAKLVLDL